jgi:hypothetical protein
MNWTILYIDMIEMRIKGKRENKKKEKKKKKNILGKE